LLHTLKVALGEKYTPKLHEAWAGVYAFVTDSMVKGANESLSLLTFQIYNDQGKRHLMSLDAYISKMLPYQTDIFYLATPLMTPNEGTKKKLKTLGDNRVKILCIQRHMADTITRNLSKYLGRKLVNVDTDVIDCRFLQRSGSDYIDDSSATSISMQSVGREELAAHEAASFCIWFQEVLGRKKVSSCSPTCKLDSVPARLLLDKKPSEVVKLKNFRSLDKIVEINPAHPVIVGIFEMRESQPLLALMLAEQVYDNCMIAGGFMEDSRVMLPRLNGLMMTVIRSANDSRSDSSRYL